MELKFRVAARIAKPVHEVFEAVADPDQLSNYFTTGGAKGRPDQRIVLRWDAADGEQFDAEGRPDMAQAGYKTTVTMNFRQLEDGRTLVEIAEEGWRENQGALEASYGNCQGWTGMLLALKVWLEHGFNLRQGLYK